MKNNNVPAELRIPALYCHPNLLKALLCQTKHFQKALQAQQVLPAQNLPASLLTADKHDN
jgi:hypothetical protein